jgi:hypothetical protein
MTAFNAVDGSPPPSQNYRDETSRRNQILTGKPLNPALPQTMSVAPKPWRQ